MSIPVWVLILTPILSFLFKQELEIGIYYCGNIGYSYRTNNYSDYLKFATEVGYNIKGHLTLALDTKINRQKRLLQIMPRGLPI
jgi:hypothetical protein